MTTQQPEERRDASAEFTARSAAACENAKSPPSRCTCRCKGAAHGVKRGPVRELPAGDWHHPEDERQNEIDRERLTAQERTGKLFPIEPHPVLPDLDGLIVFDEEEMQTLVCFTHRGERWRVLAQDSRGLELRAGHHPRAALVEASSDRQWVGFACWTGSGWRRIGAGEVATLAPRDCIETIERTGMWRALRAGWARG